MIDGNQFVMYGHERKCMKICEIVAMQFYWWYKQIMIYVKSVEGTELESFFLVIHKCVEFTWKELLSDNQSCWGFAKLVDGFSWVFDIKIA